MDVEVRHDLFKGKGVYAKKPFLKDSIIFQEDPLVSCQLSWNAAYGYLACDHCLRPLETAQENAGRLSGQLVELPYPECCTIDKSKITKCPYCPVNYCSEECKMEAFDHYHKTLCHETNGSHPLEQLNEAWKKVHYPPETNSIMLIARLLSRIQQASNKEDAIAQTLEFCHTTTDKSKNLAHKLLGEKFVNQIYTLHGLLVAAIPNEGIEHLLTFDGFLSLLALIGTNTQGVGTSAIANWATKAENLSLETKDKEVFDSFLDQLYQQMEENVGDFLNNEGVALYRLQSCCNHSCDPNAVVKFMNNNHRLSLVALKDIEEGEEICISYLDDCVLTKSRHSRCKELMNNYLFVCRCDRCNNESDQPDETSEEDDSMSD
ncbi:histone-lysine N-trimethyltransferase SMYD5 [Diorhabda sublineata]|uniref:histone-lysine N-trimethyltransferase SMYD5 n=1 Tax=Diorhabda sublineata TaxID=1163346 RepID=UPI0024E04457|nr:histone-lysine N-trimethyltransferase SMYD5 [Diorhabda sublineata]